MVPGKWSGLQGRWSDPHLGLTNVALLFQMIYRPANPAPQQTFGSGRQQGSRPPVSHSFPKGDERLPSAPWELEPIGKQQHCWSCSEGVGRTMEDFHWQKSFTPAAWFAGASCLRGTELLQCCGSEAQLAETSANGEVKQEILRVSARRGALSLFTFLTLCSKIEVLNIRVKHKL